MRYLRARVGTLAALGLLGFSASAAKKVGEAGEAGGAAPENPGALTVIGQGDFVLGGADIARLGPDGSRRWVVHLDGGPPDAGEHRVEIAVTAPSGDLVVGGTFDGELVFGAVRLRSAGDKDIFLATLSPEGAVRWVRGVGGPENDRLDALSVRGDGGVVVSGAFAGAITVGRTSLGAADHLRRTFMAVYAPGGEPLWARAFDPAAETLLTAASGDRIAFASSFRGTVDFGGGPLSSPPHKSETAVGVVDREGRTQWTKRFGGESWVRDVAVDPTGDLLVLSDIAEDIRIDNRWARIPSCSPVGELLASFSADGKLRWSHGWGLDVLLNGGHMAVDRAGNIVVAGTIADDTMLRWDGIPGELGDRGGVYVLRFSPDGRLRRGQALRSQSDVGFGLRLVFNHGQEPLLLVRSSSGSKPDPNPYPSPAPESADEVAGRPIETKVAFGHGVLMRLPSTADLERRRREREAAAAGRFPWLPASVSWALSPAGTRPLGFAASLAYLGDVDNDHIGDVAVGQPLADRVSIYSGGAQGFRKPPALLRPPIGKSKGFGAVVAAVGDLNGDGHPDLAVLAYTGDRRSGGQAAVYFGGASGISPTAGWVMPARKAKDTPAAVVAGDLDGDQVPELVVGAPDARNGRGRVYVFRGGPTGPAPAPTWILDGPKPESRFGAAIVTCDVNHDGILDLIVGAPGTEPEEGGPDAGRTGAVYVHLGGKAGPSPTSAWSTLSRDEWNGFGSALACPGDIDGDGNPDLLVAYPWSEIEGGDPWSGRLYLFAGTRAGFSEKPVWSADLGQHGATLVPAGDINGDGLADVLVGVWPGYSLVTDGRVDLYLGGRQGLAKAADWSVAGREQDFGIALGTGDVDGDGIRDILIGEPRNAVCARRPQAQAGSYSPSERVQKLEHGKVEVYLGRR